MSENEGSTFKVPLTKILAITNHPGADRLEIATVYGFQVIVKKGSYKVGDQAIYVPIDSIIPEWLENKLFPHVKDDNGVLQKPKVTLSNSRIRQIRLRGQVSQGLLISLADIQTDLETMSGQLETEKDYAHWLDITKYEPPYFNIGRVQGAPKLRNKPLTNPHFRTFNGLSNIKWVVTPFEGEEVVIQCKLHGTHVRFGKAPYSANTWFKKIKKFFGLAPKFESVYGSNKVELTNRANHTGFYGSDIYGECLSKFEAFDKIKDGEFVHGEIIGPGIQKGYHYGHTEHHLVIFDVRVLNEDGTQKWLDPEEAEEFAKERGFTFAPVLYRGVFSKEVLEKHTSGPSVYYPQEKIREGCVVKARYNYDLDQNKRAFKSINPDYLDDKTNSDFH